MSLTPLRAVEVNAPLRILNASGSTWRVPHVNHQFATGRKLDVGKEAMHFKNGSVKSPHLSILKGVACIPKFHENGILILVP